MFSQKINYENKYLKYKNKYLNLKRQLGTGDDKHPPRPFDPNSIQARLKEALDDQTPITTAIDPKISATNELKDLERYLEIYKKDRSLQIASIVNATQTIEDPERRVIILTEMNETLDKINEKILKQNELIQKKRELIKSLE